MNKKPKTCKNPKCVAREKKIADLQERLDDLIGKPESGRTHFVGDDCEGGHREA